MSIENRSLKRETSYALTIGNFDGMHRGHQGIFQRVRTLAKQHGTHTALVTFEPHPRTFFRQPVGRLNNLRTKVYLAKKFGINAVFVKRFNQIFSQQTHHEFLQYLLWMGMRFLVIGSDFRFGYKQKGDIAYLQQASKKTNRFALHLVEDVIEDQRVSSSLIRQALLQNNIQYANTLLGYTHCLVGRVVMGFQRGVKIGFPTLNLHTNQSVNFLSGVYAVYVYLEDHQRLHGVCNVGNAPTFKNKLNSVEVHVYDKKLPNLYGKLVKIEFYGYLRSEKTFSNISDLTRQIHLDIQSAKATL